MKLKIKKAFVLKSFAFLCYLSGVISITFGVVGVNSIKNKSFESINNYNENLNKTVSTKDLMASYQKITKMAEKKQKEEEQKKLKALVASYTDSDYKAYAHKLVTSVYGWSEQDYIDLVKLWNRESGWRPTASNGAGAYGIPQALPGSKMASEGADYATNGKTQIRWGLKYIKSKYGSPSNAWNCFASRGWY